MKMVNNCRAEYFRDTQNFICNFYTFLATEMALEL